MNGCSINDEGIKILCEGIENNLHLKDLILYGNKLGEEGMKALCETLKKNNSVHKLDLSETEISETAMNHLSELLESNQSHLAELYLPESKIEKNSKSIFLKSVIKNTTLEKINLQAVEFDEEEQKIIAEILKKNRTLKKIFLNQISEKSVLESLKTNTTLKKIALKLSEIEVSLLCEALIENKSLESLNLSNGDFREKDLIEICKNLENNKSLKSLNFCENKIKDNKNFSIICDSLKKNTTITSLNLSWMNLKELNAKYISELLYQNTTLKKLNLNGNKLADEGTKIVCQSLFKNFSLHTLLLSYNYIRKEGLKEICCLLNQNFSLKFLDLNSNQNIFLDPEINFHFFDSIKNNKCIQFIDLSSTNLDIDVINLIGDLIRFNSPSLKKIDLSSNELDFDTLPLILRSLQHNFHLTKLGFSEFEDDFEINLIKKIDFLLNCNKSWKLNNHVYFFKKFKDAVFSFLLCMKEMQKSFNLKVPKFVLFEIIKKIDRRSF